MRIRSNTRRTLLGMVLAGAAAGSIVQAQDSAAGRPLPVPPPGEQGDIVIRCCKCLGQESGVVNISTGTAPWRVSSVLSSAWGASAMTGPTNTSPLMMPGVISNPHPAWGTALSPASWLQPIGSTTRNDAFPQSGHVTYVLKIRVPNCTIKQKVILSGQFEADDKGTITVNNGPPLALTPLVPNPFASFGALGTKSFNTILGGGPFTAPGTYTIRVEVDQLGAGPFGMVLRGNVAGKCDDRLEKGKDDRAEDCKDC